MFESQELLSENLDKVDEEKSADPAEGAEAANTPSITELEKLEKFSYAGREMTAKDLQSMVMMQSDYTRKTQAIAEERKYYENLQSDLDAVKSNPTLMAQFKQVYPEKFHKFLGYVASDKPVQEQVQQQSGVLDPKIQERLDKYDQIAKEWEEQKISAINAQLDAKFGELTKKYPYADEEAVIARAQALLDKGEKLTDSVWDTLWKSVHDRSQKLWSDHQKSLNTKQQSANSKGRDIGHGGGTPGQAPKVPKSIKEASKMLMESGEYANL